MLPANRETLQISFDAEIMAGNKATETFHTTVVNLICRRLRCECNITFTIYSWNASSSNGFHDYFQDLFGGDNPVDIGVSALLMTPERIRTVDFIFPPESKKFGIALYDNALVPIDQGAFFTLYSHECPLPRPSLSLHSSFSSSSC
ncbi:hypothetical protein BV898_18817 [Hypsibius exemplaris]|uniref:Uncharacterized protein n=1 Tax=Hypsibius exemplaris TaxID=2072580 RepID=A0A9X6NKM0_HYPEX|nr:hypothetical protein BV898_18817 [Hypsibius exemplaris]